VLTGVNRSGVIEIAYPRHHPPIPRRNRLRGCVGMTGAVIVSFFLQAGVLSGGLFPAFPSIGLQVTDFPSSQQVGATTQDFARFHLILPDKDLALLIVWSFLAGFSERLVPTILQDTETAIGKKA